MRMAILMTLAALTLASPLASATNNNVVGPLFPKWITSDNSGIVYVFFQGTITVNGVVESTRNGAVPTCATDNAGPVYRLAFDSKTGAGKSMLSILLTTHAAGEGVWFNGTGTCDVTSTIESLQSVQSGN